MEFDVFVLLGVDARSGNVVPLGCNESFSIMERVQTEAVETLRMSALTMRAEDKDLIEESIASMAIVPATLFLDV